MSFTPVAVSLIRDDIAARYWPAVADRYVDWVVHERRYGGDRDEHTRGWFGDEVLVDGVDEGPHSATWTPSSATGR